MTFLTLSLFPCLPFHPPIDSTAMDSDTIDLDPYESSVTFLHSSVRTIGDVELLAITYTDIAVLCTR